MSGQNTVSFLQLERFADATRQHLLGSHEEPLGNKEWCRRKGQMLSDTGELLLNSFTTQVQFCEAHPRPDPISWWIWKLIPVNVEDA